MIELFIEVTNERNQSDADRLPESATCGNRAGTVDRGVMRMRKVIWTAVVLLVVIGIAAASRRTLVLLVPSTASTRVPAAANLDKHFSGHKTLTLVHIIPGALFLLLAPLQFAGTIRAKQLWWHRWSGRILVVLGLVIGISALMMSYTASIGGANETAATTLFAILFLAFLGKAFWHIRRREICQHREWMIRGFGTALGIATTRPIVGAFFAAGRLSPQEFFGIAFWLGFSLTLMGAEAWIHYTAGANVAKTT
jgi:hypothetical protein